MKYNRKILFSLNKYQKKFFYPIFFSFLIGCLFSWLSLTYFFLDFYCSPSLTLLRLKVFIPWVLIGFAFLGLTIVIWTCYLSNKVLGPYERVIRELDETIEGKRKGPISVRKGDTMFSELVNRINSLIQRIE